MKYLLFSIAITITSLSFSQDYFQQRVDYKIAVQLYDQENILRGYEMFEYLNNSPNTLDFIYVHLWPNGYKNSETALAQQLLDMKNNSMANAEAVDLGFIDSLDFKINNEKVNWELDPIHIDICKVYLKSPLKPGEKMTVDTPFRVKIPSGRISRLGFVDESYQITQWYPKPAVYDKDGWHQMPYLTQGEFYSEFGSFSVEITLPKNYVVGATGDLQTQSEIDFLNERVAQTKKNYEKGTFEGSDGKSGTVCPESSKELKTIRFTQNNIHDFGWFADKRFEVLKGEVELPNSKRKVTSWAMFVPHHSDLWKESIEYLNDAIYFYSKWNGEYPYDQVTAVDGTISAGGGMEYPNVTVIGNSSSREELEVVIVHEVGHNWFYGLLGSNERDHAWMDEGLNTLNEIRYMQTKYPNNRRMSEMANGVVGKLHFDHLNHQDMADLTYNFVAGFGLDQPIELTSADYKSLNYGAIVYSKTGLIFLYLKDYLGDEKFDAAMRAYYNEWHYKHPQPEDIKNVLERETGKDLSWLFYDLIQTTKQIDYKIQGVKIKDGVSTVKVRNTGQVDGPIRIDALSQGQVKDSIWIEPGEKVNTVTFKNTSYDQFVIDYGKQIPEVNRNNNYWTKKGLFHRVEPFKMEFMAGDNEPFNWNNYWMPAIGGNVYDKFMIGFIFHNQTIPKNKFEYTIAPLFSFGRTNVSGFADLNYSWVPAKNIRMVSIGVKGKTFGNGLNALSTESITTPSTYYTVQPYLNFEIGKPIAKKYYRQNLYLMGSYVVETGNGIDNDLYSGTAQYKFDYNKKRHAVSAGVRLDYYDAKNGYNNVYTNSQRMNASVEAAYTFEYWDDKNKHITIRGFIGDNLSSGGVLSSRYGFAIGGQSGLQDVNYENYLFGRNRSYGVWSNQRIDNQGGFKTTSGITTNGTILTSNLLVEIPYIPFLVAYADYGLYESVGTMESIYDVGVGLKLASMFAVYFPLYESTNLKNSFGPQSEYGEKIRFTLDLTGLSLSKIIGTVL